MLTVVNINVFAGEIMNKVYVNGVMVEGEPDNKNGTIFVPLRGVFESMGTNVDWNSQNKQVTVKHKDITLLIEIGKNEIIKKDSINSSIIKLDSTPYLKDGSARIPLRAVAECLGAQVLWNISNKSVYINFEEEISGSNKVSDSEVVIDFSVGNVILSLNEPLESILNKLNTPNRIDKLNDQFSWYIYNSDYNNFCMIGIQEYKAVAFYSNAKTASINGNLYENFASDLKAMSDILPSNMGLKVFKDDYRDSKIQGFIIFADNANLYPLLDQNFLDKTELQIFDIVNAERVKFNLDAYKLNEVMIKSSRVHSLLMARTSTFAHVLPDEPELVDRIKLLGFVNFSLAGENIAAGFLSGYEVVNSWINSELHRANVLSSQFTDAGVGAAKTQDGDTYFTQDYFR